MTINTKRLIITALNPEQLQAEISITPDEHLKAAYSEMLDACRADVKNEIWHTLWLISERETGEKAGSLAFMGTPVNGETEIGYGIDEKFRRKGYAYEAVKAAIKWAFGQNGVNCITAMTEKENTASKALLEKLCFKQTGEDEENLHFCHKKAEFQD